MLAYRQAKGIAVCGKDLVRETAGFFVWANHHLDTSDIEHDYTSLLDYLTRWMESGDAIEFCGGDYVVFLRIVALVIAEVAENPEKLGFHDEAQTKPRRLEKLLDLEGSSGVVMFDPWYWRKLTFDLMRTPVSR